GGTSNVHLRGSVLIFTMRPSRTCAFTTQRPPQLCPHVLVTIVSPGAAAVRGASYEIPLIAWPARSGRAEEPRAPCAPCTSTRPRRATADPEWDAARRNRTEPAPHAASPPAGRRPRLEPHAARRRRRRTPAGSPPRARSPRGRARDGSRATRRSA